MSNSIIKDKSFNFSLEIISTYNYLKTTKNEFVLSKRDFLSKMSIALKEAEETEYWLELLILSNYLDYKQEKLLLENCRELCKILSSIVRTTKSNKVNSN